MGPPLELEPNRLTPQDLFVVVPRCWILAKPRAYRQPNSKRGRLARPLLESRTIMRHSFNELSVAAIK